MAIDPVNSHADLFYPDETPRRMVYFRNGAFQWSGEPPISHLPGLSAFNTYAVTDIPLGSIDSCAEQQVVG